MNASMLLDLRPLSIAELFDRSFRLYRNNFGTFLGIMLFTQIPIYLFSIVTAAVDNSAASGVLEKKGPMDSVKRAWELAKKMYFDLRIRFEGFDLMVLASADDEFTVDVSDLTTKTTL